MEHGFAHLEETPHSQRHERLEEPLFIPADDMDDDHLVMDMMTSRGGVENEHQETEVQSLASSASPRYIGINDARLAPLMISRCWSSQAIHRATGRWT
jgi:hypothetical protein